MKTPTTYWDELNYYGIARSFYQSMGISIRNMSANFQSILYSVVRMPIFAIQDSKIRAYVITVINSVSMNSCVSFSGNFAGSWASVESIYLQLIKGSAVSGGRENKF